MERGRQPITRDYGSEVFALSVLAQRIRTDPAPVENTYNGDFLCHRGEPFHCDPNQSPFNVDAPGYGEFTKRAVSDSIAIHNKPLTK